MAFGGDTTSTLSANISIYYEKRFLRYAEKKLVMGRFAQRKPLPLYNGKTVYFTRYTPLAKVTTALTEGTNPSVTNLSSTTISVVVAEWGAVVQPSSLLLKTSIDPELKTIARLQGEQAGKSIDWQIMKEACESGTAQVVSTAANLAAITATDVLLPKDIELAVRDLEWQDASTTEDGNFICVIEPYAKYDFMAGTGWTNAAEYAGSDAIYENDIGKWAGVRFVKTTQPYRSSVGGVQSDTGAVRWLPVFGSEAFGLTELLKGTTFYVVDTPDSNNPLLMYSQMSWKQTYGTKVLNANWIKVIQVGVTA